MYVIPEPDFISIKFDEEQIFGLHRNYPIRLYQSLRAFGSDLEISRRTPPLRFFAGKKHIAENWGSKWNNKWAKFTICAKTINWYHGARSIHSQPLSSKDVRCEFSLGVPLNWRRHVYRNEGKFYTGTVGAISIFRWRRSCWGCVVF